MAQITEKDEYAELTDKQKRVVDELVKEPNAQNTVIADRANVSRATVYNVQQHYPHIVEAKLNETGRYEGEEKTEGDPYDLLEEEIAPQWIGNRPNQPERSNDIDVEVEEEPEADTDGDGDDAVVTIPLGRVEVRDVLENRECAHVRDAVVDALINQAFVEQSA